MRCALERVRFGYGIALATLLFRPAGAEDRLSARFRAEVQPILVEHCHDCHGDGMKKGEVALDAPEADLLANHDLWWAVMKNVRAGIMPPAHKARPGPEEVRKLEDWIQRDVFRIDPADPDPGRVTIRRLNRVEYRNTIRDLMGIDFNTEEEFPPDDTGYGFDTIGDVLSTSPLLLEKYLLAAEAIVAAAVPRVPRVIPEQTVSGAELRGPDGKRQADRLSFYDAADIGCAVRVEVPGDYRLLLGLEVYGQFEFDPGRCRVTLLVDGKDRFQKEIPWHNNKRFEEEIPEELAAGEHRLDLRLEPLTPPEKRLNSLFLRVSSVKIRGPLDERHWTPPRNYARFFPRATPPDGLEERRAYAREVIESLARKAFRRPVDAATVDRPVPLPRRGGRAEHARPAAPARR
jgi:mono/diheme cytochrome c family protein